jgi:hypothetical protein
MLDDMNARHAKEYANCTKAETLELLRRGAAVAAARVRALSDEDLAKSRPLGPGGPPMIVEALIAAGLLGHIDDHFGSIRRTVGH